MTITEEYELRREANRTLVRKAQRKVMAAERRLRGAIAVRDSLFFEVHGPRAEGGLSYQEISDATGGAISKGRLVQIIQPRYQEVDSENTEPGSV